MTATEETRNGFGRVHRKEDARFIRGKGTYVDDIRLPGTLFGAVLRSPHAHARLLSVDTTAAEAHPQVRAVITGAALAELDLAWMPTLSGGVQAVLATDKVRFQGQEVAFVVAESHYAARDALELIDVDYEALPPVVDARKALDEDAPVIRDDLEGRTGNRIFDWEAGDAGHADRVFAESDVVVAQDVLYPRVHPAPLETCGIVADMDKVTGKLTVWTTTQAPHAHRTVYALVAGLPEHKIRVVSPRHRRRLRQQGRDLPGLRVRDRRVDRDGPSGEVDGGPLREPDDHLVRPGTTTCGARSPRPGTGGSAACG
ncbi:hypothetical protein GCM10010191_78960 [Actinomadura vinacea]|uniref:Aldehyde oxidase/xanthine dehydrogenase a/b hammerhead domain-containing protein n=1 Tax=Actinomadura vinacea TaxID=115336 RepID=A0ABN3K4V8_9ACTN